MTELNLRLLKERRPDKDPWFIKPVADSWFQRYLDQGKHEKAHAIEGTLWRASMAGSCSRQMAYYLAGFRDTEPPDLATAWRFEIGNLAHADVQAIIEDVFPGSKCEVTVKIGELGSGRMDVLVMRPNEDGEPFTSSVEIKTMNGTGFKSMRFGLGSKPPEGLSWKHIAQGSVNAASFDPLPDELVIVIMSLELHQAKASESVYDRFCAQYTFTQSEYLAVAEYEINRVERIAEIVERKGPSGVRRIIPDPSMPRHVVVQPGRGLYEILDSNDQSLGTGFTWHCNYCPYQTQCQHDREGGE